MFGWLILFMFTQVSIAQNPIIHLEDGTIKGTINRTEGKGLEYHAFRGIPYAAPPIGCLRFKPPQSPKKWPGVLDATKDGPQCVETDLRDMKTIKGQEDCLTINVYTPAIGCKLKVMIPTMVWIYGGAFIGGTSSNEKFGPDYLLDNCVCFVSFNYRVGIFGFISTGDTKSLGNYGLKDQIFALQWVQRNVEKFGCNKSNVLLFGESAGSASISILTQVKKTEGLFHKAIMESGTSLCMWSRARQARKLAFQFGNHLGIRTKQSKVLIQSLRNKTTQELQRTFILKLFQEVKGDPLNNLMGIGPVIESQSNESIFTSQSYEAINNGYSHKIPMIIGFNSNEAATMDFYPLSSVGHNEELSYIFKRYRNYNISACASKIRNTMCKLWTNMAHTGNPTVGPTGYKLEIQWTKVNASNVSLLNIDRNSYMIQNPYSKTLTFWKDLYKKYAKRPFDTY